MFQPDLKTANDQDFGRVSVRVTTFAARIMQPRNSLPARVKMITCLGSGFVGGPTSAVMAFEADVVVTVVDVDAGRIAAWKSDFLPIFEPGLDLVVHAVRDGAHILEQDTSEDTAKLSTNAAESIPRRLPNLFFSTDIDKAIEEADVIFVCVNTPTKSRGDGRGAIPDLSFVEAATRNIARVAKRDKIIVEKSTVPCKTAELIQELLCANGQPGVKFDVLSNPEFLAEGSAINDLMYPDRIIIGSLPTKSGLHAAGVLADVYAQWVPREKIITMNLWSSELSKLAANAMLAQRISSVNALSAICEATGANVDEVSHACGLDSRIGPGMLKAGPGFGGSCFQKDIFNIVYLAESLRLYEVADYWRAIIEMNCYQKRRFINRIISCLQDNLMGKKIAVLGFAFKKNTSDTRESPAITFVSSFVAEGAQVTIYDPKVKEEQVWTDLVNEGGNLESLRHHVEVCASAYAACFSANAVVVLTEWDEFSNRCRNESQENTSATKILSERHTNTVLTTNRMIINSPVLKEAAGSRSKNTDSGPEGPRSSILSRMLARALTLEDNQSDRPGLDWERIARSMKKPSLVFDGRNILDHEKLEAIGFRVEAIGRSSSAVQHKRINQ